MNYTASGTIRVGGCAYYTLEHNYISNFSVGDTLFILPKARKGILQKITIKKIRFFSPNDPRITNCINCSFAPLYIDTFNAYHNEEDLATYDEAYAIASDYLELIAANLESNLLNCN